jgi:hypothetical protein
MTLPVEAFLRRFLLHLLPRGFVRIRNFGFLANRQRAMLFPLCFRLLQDAAEITAPTASPVADHSHSLWNCPVCGGTMPCRRTAFSSSTLASLPASPRVRCMNPQPQPRIILVLWHVQSLCVSAGPQCPASLLSCLGRPPQSIRSRAATAAHSRQQQLCKSSKPAQPYTKPIGSREGRLPSSRCI